MTGLSVRGLTVRRGRRIVLEDVSFSAAAGGITAILGPPACGKTTLLAAIAGFLAPERGAVLVGGTDVTKLSARRRGIGFLAPGAALPEARDTGAALRRMAGRGAGQTAADMLAALAPDLAGQAPHVLTHGEHFLALAVARVARQGQVLLVDEAGQGLAPGGWQAFGEILRREAAAGRAVVLATRSPDVARFADHLVLLEAGQVVQSGAPYSLYAEPRTERAARMTGEANILRGRIREVRAGGFVWVAEEGGRFVHAVDPEMPRPALGTEVVLCLRPERVALLAAGEAADNVLEAEITDVRAAGPVLEVRAQVPSGAWGVVVPSWHAPYVPAIGQVARLAWAADAAWLLA